jgi:hypothetical protein
MLAGLRQQAEGPPDPQRRHGQGQGGDPEPALPARQQRGHQGECRQNPQPRPQRLRAQPGWIGGLLHPRRRRLPQEEAGQPAQAEEDEIHRLDLRREAQERGAALSTLYIAMLHGRKRLVGQVGGQWPHPECGDPEAAEAAIKQHILELADELVPMRPVRPPTPATAARGTCWPDRRPGSDH